ncbi:CHAT domain-containing protein [Bradyrhizobium diazoefficiens]|nr:CHAT domain-containing protein [Bradyrhizobium diazoefficiens]MBR0850727.1 CHAT domain-containing protein [Bradyrhizobium diazoefficiens]
MKETIEQYDDPHASAAFATAVDLFTRKRLWSALDIFELIAQSDEWFDRCAAYLLGICSELLQTRPAVEKETRLREIEKAVIARMRQRAVQENRPTDVRPWWDDDAPMRGSLPGTPLPQSFDLPPTPITESGGAPATEPQIRRVVERTPHMDIVHQGTLEPGATFSVLVWLDRLGHRSGEIASNVVAPSGTQIEAVLVASSHFEIIGADRATFLLDPGQETISLPPYEMRVVREHNEGEAPCLIVVFFVEQRACGKIARMVDVGPSSNNGPTRSTRVVVPPTGSPTADLVVTIAADPSGNGRQFGCMVSSPHLESYKTPATGVWNPGDETSRIVTGFMDRFTSDQTPSDMLTDELRGAGKQLFAASPRVFQRALWALIDAKAPISTIAIVSEEPFFPWELMVPHRIVGTKREERNPLGIDFGIGRWTDPNLVSPAWSVNLVDSFVVAPRYSGSARLPNAESEAEMVLAAYQGQRQDPATFSGLRKGLLAQSRSIIHFVCHGGTSAIDQTIRLEDASMTTTALLGIPGLAEIISDRRPLVFLNACEVGRLKPALVGVRGFASAFIELGAAAVIAPLWSVEDGAAHEVAKIFYQAVKSEPDKAFSQVMAQIRSKAYIEAKDTFAAYCFFGDPLASASKSKVDS